MPIPRRGQDPFCSIRAVVNERLTCRYRAFGQDLLKDTRLCLPTGKNVSLPLFPLFFPKGIAPPSFVFRSSHDLSRRTDAVGFAREQLDLIAESGETRPSLTVGQSGERRCAWNPRSSPSVSELGF